MFGWFRTKAAQAQKEHEDKELQQLSNKDDVINILKSRDFLTYPEDKVGKYSSTILKNFKDDESIAILLTKRINDRYRMDWPIDKIISEAKSSMSDALEILTDESLLKKLSKDKNSLEQILMAHYKAPSFLKTLSVYDCPARNIINNLYSITSPSKLYEKFRDQEDASQRFSFSFSFDTNSSSASASSQSNEQKTSVEDDEALANKEKAKEKVPQEHHSDIKNLEEYLNNGGENPFKLLKLSPDESRDAVKLKKAFYSGAKELHPDKSSEESNKYIALQSAKDLLSTEQGWKFAKEFLMKASPKSEEKSSRPSMP